MHAPEFEFGKDVDNIDRGIRDHGLSGEIVFPFVAGEVNFVMQPGPSGRAAVTVLLDGKPIGDARGMDVGTDGVARFERSGDLSASSPARHNDVLTLASSDPGLRAYVFTFGPEGRPVPRGC